MPLMSLLQAMHTITSLSRSGIGATPCSETVLATRSDQSAGSSKWVSPRRKVFHQDIMIALLSLDPCTLVLCSVVCQASRHPSGEQRGSY